MQDCAKPDEMIARSIACLLIRLDIEYLASVLAEAGEVEVRRWAKEVVRKASTGSVVGTETYAMLSVLHTWLYSAENVEIVQASTLEDMPSRYRTAVVVCMYWIALALTGRASADHLQGWFVLCAAGARGLPCDEQYVTQQFLWAAGQICEGKGEQEGALWCCYAQTAVSGQIAKYWIERSRSTDGRVSHAGIEPGDLEGVLSGRTLLTELTNVGVVGASSGGGQPAMLGLLRKSLEELIVVCDVGLRWLRQMPE